MKKREFVIKIETEGKNPVMVANELKRKVRKEYDVIVEDDAVVVRRLPCAA